VNRTRTTFGAVFLLTLALGTGCARPGQRNEDFIPQEEAARKALDAYLAAWACGETAQAIPDTQPQVMAVDEVRLKGRALTGYKILGPVPADAPLCFAVQLSLGNPAAEVRERYVVVGLDPLWVWRYDDYLMITHWCHPMPDPKADPKSPAKR
jgi:hypothetical protein